MSENRSLYTALSLFALTFTTILQEISLIRIFDIFYWPGATFFVVTLFFISFGVSGFFSYKWADEFSIGVAQSLFFPSCYLSAFCFQQFEAPWVIGGPLLFLPFLFGGFAITGYLNRNKAQVFYFYFWDLMGLAAGGMFGLFVLPYVGPLSLINGVALTMSLLGCFLFLKHPVSLLISAVSVTILLLTIFIFENQFHPLPRIEKYLSQQVKPHNIEYSSWNPVAKIDVVDMERSGEHPKIYLESSKKELFFDGGTLGTTIFAFDGNYEKLRADFLNDPRGYFLRLSTVAAHYLNRKEPYTAYLLGVGAGQEVKAALMFGADRVVANELIDEILELGKTTYAKYNGGIFLDSRVQTISGDGRISLKKQKEKFDVIQIFSNYLSSSLARGRGFFSPSYLLTQEAFDEYFDRLSERGILQINHHGSDLILQTARDTWQRKYETPFENHVLRIRKQDKSELLTTVLIKKKPWHEFEVAELIDLFDRHPSEKFLIEKKVSLKQKYNQTPTDNRPFFSRIYETHRDHPFASLINKISIGLFGLLFLFLILPGQTKQSIFERSYFAGTGLAFAILQLSFDKIFLQYLEFPHYVHILSICLLPVGMGLGSLWLQKLRPLLFVTACPLILVIFGFSYGAIFEFTFQFSFEWRAFFGASLVTLIGMMLGIYFPMGIATSESMKWNWLANGLGAATGAVFAEYLQFTIGFQNSILICAVCYLALGLRMQQCSNVR